MFIYGVQVLVFSIIYVLGMVSVGHVYVAFKVNLILTHTFFVNMRVTFTIVTLYSIAVQY